ncbi:MAG: hypothetical protein E7188_07945 [Erysipelotrichaceae bacterium]|nr:hypothetical protein [Erysipelotrichaceae bacterium]
MEKQRTLWKNAAVWGIPVLFFLFFFLISRYAPLAGDDWGYAAGGRYNSALMRAWQNYFSWSGRFFSELWGYGIAPHKKLWNVLNAAVFTGILVMMRRLSGAERHPLLIPAVLVLMMLSVPHELRMQTYTWIMGTTYVIPLMLFLIYVKLLKDYVFDNRMSTLRFAVCVLLNFMIPLFMENAAAMIFGADCLVLIYVCLKDKNKRKSLILFTAIAAVGVVLIRFSPGAMARSARDHAAFAELSLMQKIAVNIPNLMHWTFTAYPFFYAILSAVVLLYLRTRKGLVRNAGVLVCLLSYAVIPGILPQALTWLFWMVYLAVLFAVALDMDTVQEKLYAVFVLLCGCGANAVMLVSPIFAARSSVYTLFLFMLYGLILLERTELPDRAGGILTAMVCTGVVICAVRWMMLYRMINRINLKRMSQIQYYADRPDIEDLWIMGYPENTVHSADVVEGDDFHDAVFKEYYFLNPDSTLHFYYLKDYSTENILNG